MKAKVDYQSLPEKAYKSRIKLLRSIRKQLEMMLVDEIKGSVSARASAAKQLNEIDAELTLAVQSRGVPANSQLREVTREKQLLQLRVADLEQKVAELEASLVAQADG